MIQAKIEDLKKKLNMMVDEGLDSEQVYSLSVELDKLIVKYYEKRNNKYR